MEKLSKREKKIRKLEKKLQKLKDKEYKKNSSDVMELTVQKVTIPKLIDLPSYRNDETAPEPMPMPPEEAAGAAEPSESLSMPFQETTMDAAAKPEPLPLPLKDKEMDGAAAPRVSDAVSTQVLDHPTTDKKVDEKEDEKEEKSLEAGAQDIKTMAEKSVYEKILEQARETDKRRPVYTTGYFRSVRMIFTAFFADPQATLSAQLTDPDHRAAWTFFMTGVAAFLAGGLFSGGIASGLQAAVLYTIYMMIYPFLVAIVSGAGRNVGIRDILSVFWVSGIFIDCVHVFSVLCMLMGLWFLAIVAEILALPLGIVFNYMATTAVYGGDNKRAIRTTIIALVTFMLLMIAAGFLLIAISIINSALGQMMDGGFNIPALIEFILQYVK